MNSTSINLTVLTDDLEYFEDLAEDSAPSDRFPGMHELNVDAAPRELESFLERPFFGKHGSHSGDYPAHSVCCAGKGAVFTHVADENGSLSMYVTDPWATGDAPLQISSFTMQYLTVARRIVADMLEAAASSLAAKLKKVEEEELAKRENAGEDPEKG